MDIQALLRIAIPIAIRVGTAIAIFLIGGRFSKWMKSLSEKYLKRAHTEPTLVSFVSSVVYYLAITVTSMAAISRLGVDLTSVAAIIGAGGIAVGLAVQGTLTNISAGFILIANKQAKVGDWIELHDPSGWVIGKIAGIDLITTSLESTTGKCIIVPNGKVTRNILVNHGEYLDLDTVRANIRLSQFSEDDDIDTEYVENSLAKRSSRKH